MAKRGGLGRGLDALIPVREEKKDKQQKTDTKEISPEVRRRADAIVSGKESGGTSQKTKTNSAQSAGKKSTGTSVKSKENRTVPEKKSEEINPKDGVINLKISAVEPNRDQPRKYFDESAIEELADSIRQFGIIQPLLVQKKDGYYEIIAGERRWRAAKKAGLKEVPVIIREFSNQEAVEVSLIENIQREDLNPIEEARAYERLISEYGLGQEEVAGRVSKSRSAVANSMRLLKLTDEVQKLVETGELSEGHARTVIPLSSPALQINAVDQILKNHLSVRQTEKLVKDLLSPSKTRSTAKENDNNKDALLNSLAENLKAALGTRVSIHQMGKKKGRIEIEYYSDDDLDRLYELLRAVK